MKNVYIHTPLQEFGKLLEKFYDKIKVEKESGRSARSRKTWNLESTKRNDKYL